MVTKPTQEGAIYALNLLAATGIGILLAAVVGGRVTLQACAWPFTAMVVR